MAFGNPVRVACVWLCRRDRRHGKPSGLLHGGGGGFSRAWKCTEVDENGRTRWSAPTLRGIGLSRGRRVKGAKAGWKAGRRLESLPHKNSLPHRRACATRGRTRWSAPTRRGIGLCGGRSVKGAKAGWKAGRRLESLPHIGHDTEGTEKSKPRRTRRTRRWEKRGRRVEVERGGVRAG